MSLKSLRESKGLSRKEVSELSGISLRSLQDYEQGHKDIACAKGGTLYRLSLVLGCTMEDILDSHFIEVTVERKEEQKRLRRLLSYHVDLSISKEEIEHQEIHSEKYKIYGKWKLDEKNCNLMFLYKGNIIQLPFNVPFSKSALPWLVEAAVMKIESYIDQVIFNQQFGMIGGSYWNE